MRSSSPRQMHSFSFIHSTSNAARASGNCAIEPTSTDIQSFLSFLSNREKDDRLIEFRFSQPDESPVQILSSRLEYAEGPLAAIIKSPFVPVERENLCVTLSPEDDPDSFHFVRKFLYREPILLKDENYNLCINLTRITKVISTAHRWQLQSLFTSFSRLILMEKLIRSLNDVLIVVQIIRLPGIPRDVLVYFWRMVGKYYHRIRVRLQANVFPPEEYGEEETETDESISYETNTEETETNEANSINPNIEPMCPSFQDLWPLVISHELVHTLINSIINTMKRISSPENNTYGDPDPIDHAEIEGLIFGYLAQQIKKDSDLCSIIDLLKLSKEDLDALLNNDHNDKYYCVRSMRLLGRSMLQKYVSNLSLRCYE